MVTTSGRLGSRWGVEEDAFSDPPPAVLEAGDEDADEFDAFDGDDESGVEEPSAYVVAGKPEAEQPAQSHRTWCCFASSYASRPDR